MNYDVIPVELKQLPQWVCVKNKSKIPMQALADRAASSTNKTTWSSFTNSVESVNKGYYDQIGFVFADNGIVGIDIDCGFSNDGLLSETAMDIMRACQSYTEKSRSGRGVHILVKGSLPFAGKNNLNGVEIYKSSRYFIMTGKKLIFSELIENQDAIDYIVQKYFPDSVREESSGCSNKIYNPIYPKLSNGKIALRPYYPPINQGSRNISLTSLAGQLHNQGYEINEIYNELLHANKQACNPPLPESEVISIVQSIVRYRR